MKWDGKTKAQWLREQYPIDPKSLAGTLLREFDSPRDAFEYAKKQVCIYDMMGRSNENPRWEYSNAASIILEYYLDLPEFGEI